MGGLLEPPRTPLLGTPLLCAYSCSQSKHCHSVVYACEEVIFYTYSLTHIANAWLFIWFHDNHHIVQCYIYLLVTIQLHNTDL